MEFGREVVCDYLERNKIPKLENLKLDLSGAIDGMMDFNAELDKISKDIQKRKDNAMAMAFTKDIGDLLKKNGVCPKFEEYSDRVMGETKIEMRYGVGLIGLDFSEHDKPFEDKIDKLEKELSALRRRCNSVSALHAFDAKSFYRLHIVSKNTEDENTELKKQVDKLEDKNKNLVNMINEIQLEKAHIDCDLYNAKQRIAKLESEKSENCEKEPISDDARPSSEWYENRYQQDCITINRLNTTIDVLIHKIEYLRQFAGLE